MGKTNNKFTMNNINNNFFILLWILFFSSSNSAELSSELSEIYVQLSAIEADKAPARASVILDGLGFNPDMQKKATKHFSGGWRMRLALARALFSKWVN